jgi:hypothetical protein
MVIFTIMAFSFAVSPFILFPSRQSLDFPSQRENELWRSGCHCVLQFRPALTEKQGSTGERHLAACSNDWASARTQRTPQRPMNAASPARPSVVASRSGRCPTIAASSDIAAPKPGGNEVCTQSECSEA